jgi:hypothetical protein
VLATAGGWRQTLSGWPSLVGILAHSGVRVDGVDQLPTEFVPWEFGGTYRHRSFVRCDGRAAERAWDGAPREGVASQGGTVIRRVFGSTARSRAGVVFHPDGVEVYQDQ